MTDKLLFDVSEVAELLGISRPTVYRLINRSVDKLPSMLIGNRRKISRTALIEWLAKEEHNAVTF